MSDDFCLIHGRDRMAFDRGPIPYCQQCAAAKEAADEEIMRRNITMLEANHAPHGIRVSAEHYLWLARRVERYRRAYSELLARTIPAERA